MGKIGVSVRIVGGKNNVVIADELNNHRQLFLMFSRDPALALEILTRFQLARRRVSTLFHGVVHAMKKKRNPAAIAFEKRKLQFRMPLANAAADDVDQGH